MFPDLQGERAGGHVARHRKDTRHDHGLQGVPHRHHRALRGHDDRGEVERGGGGRPPQDLQAPEPIHLHLHGEEHTHSLTHVFTDMHTNIHLPCSITPVILCIFVGFSIEMRCDEH